ncbi:ribosome biogenesis GTPase Der [Aestuariimicrobium sp. T2.26MG-19.2B]|uniref:ribosome biogenesis GTPase Der n=1 Tax=Aestuariimicrobium sp. T2.26MG-19.2B TaxID=3040679 RepID=UPI002477C602|nr:ribosome biogenesis GTPase Der [Aestuariimicrobium sp. T2.26MG-19.2B]CAI9409808.1 GTPase Der [Aestuariimicrobium sp. T2.26MG-19.2B]
MSESTPGSELNDQVPTANDHESFDDSAIELNGFGDTDLDLDEFDVDAGELEFTEYEREQLKPRPVLAVVGRPNVGKSTLVNRILGRREAVVQDVPGVTRDRVSYDADWNGRDFVIVDTGGWMSDAKGMSQQIAEQAEMAISLADAVLFVVDATVGTLDEDEAVVQVLRRSKKPVILAANKVDDQRREAEAASMWNLGLGMPWPVSGMHGRGTGDLLDAILEVLPQEPANGEVRPTGPRRVAIVGKPNVGKSSLLNKLSNSNRAVVSDVSGTTVDPVDELVDVAGTNYRFIDTAGIRRRVKEASGHEYYASLRTQTAIERAEVCVVVVDAHEEITEQDLRILSMVEETGRALVIAYNKWDLTDEERRHYLSREIERDVYAFQWAPHVNISALTGRNVDRLGKAIEAALEGWETRISTGKLNAFLGRITASHPHPVRSGKQPRILFGTQAQNCPPTFVLFTSGQLDAQYERFVQRRLREEFGFMGTPVHVSVRARAKRKDR